MRSLQPRRTAVRVVAALLLCLPLGLVPLPGGPAAADDPLTDRVESAQARREQVRRELAASTEAMVQAVTALRDAEGYLPAARAAEAQARLALASARARQAAAAAARGSAQVHLVRTERAAVAAAEDAEAQRRELGRMARAAYEIGPGNDWLALLEARSPAELGDRLLVLDAVANARTAALTRHDQVVRTYESRAADLTAARDQLNVAHEQVEAQLAVLAEAEKAATDTALRLTHLVDQRRQALAAARSALAEDTARYNELAAEASALQAQLRARARAERGGVFTPVTPQSGLLSRPVDGPTTSPFGMRRHPITGVYKLHSGTDFGVPCGTPIRASADGTVISTGFNRAYGNRVVMAHGLLGGASLATTYNHQSDIAVSAGQQVRRGQVVGSVGSTGYSTGCHLHFEVLADGNFVNPMGWL